LTVDEEHFLKRKFSLKQVEAQHSQIVKERREHILKERQEARQQALAEAKEAAGEGEGEEEHLPETEEETEQPEDLDPDAPKLEDMIQETKEKLIQQREADL